MKKLLLLLALISANAFSQEAYSPSFSSMSRLCQAEGHKMATFGKCLAGKLDKYRPDWRSQGKGYEDIQWLISFLDTLGARVKKKELSDSEAGKLFGEEALAVANRRQAQQQAAATETEKQQAAEEKRRNEAFQRDHQERQAREQAEREREQYNYRQAQLKQQEEQLRQQRNQQLIETGIQLMQLGQPRYAPTPPMPVTCTSDRWNGMVTTTCQ